MSGSNSVVPASLADHVGQVASHAQKVVENGEVAKVVAGLVSKVTPQPVSGFLKTVNRVGPTAALNQKVGVKTVTAVKATFEAFQTMVIASSTLLLIGRIAMGNNIRGVGAAVMTRVAMWYFGWLPTLLAHTAAIVASKALPESVNNRVAGVYNWSADKVGAGVEFMADKVRRAVVQLAS